MKTKEQIIKVPDDVAKQINCDLPEDSIKIYKIPDIPASFVNKDLIHPSVLAKSTSVFATASGCQGDGRRYFILGSLRLDYGSSGWVTDIDPIVFASDLLTNSPEPTGVKRFHGDFEGRTSFEIRIGDNKETVLGDLRYGISGSFLKWGECSSLRFENAMYYMADICRHPLS